MNEQPTTDTPTLIKAMRELTNTIKSGDGVANAAIAEAAERLEHLEQQRIWHDAYSEYVAGADSEIDADATRYAEQKVDAQAAREAGKEKG